MKTKILMLSLGSGAVSTVVGISTIFVKWNNYELASNLYSVAMMLGLFGIISGLVGFAYPADTNTTVTNSDVSKGA